MLKMLWQKLKIICFSIYSILKGGENMDVIYATLIVRGYRTYSQVPLTLKERVKQVLIELDMEDLVTE